MGNNQSQTTEDDDSVPRYNYHESVLRDAQTEFVSSHTLHSDDVDNGDEYHSAEENDNDHNSTDNSPGNEDNDDGRSESHDGRSESHDGRGESHDGRSESHNARRDSHEQHNLIHRLNSHMPGAEEPSMTNSPADLNPWQPLSGYSCSRLHRNEHLHRALKSRRQRSSSRLRESDRKHKLAIDPLSNNRKIPINEVLTMNTSDSCQLTAISQSGVSQNTPADNHESGSYLGKRKLPDLQLETILPRKKTLIRNSSKRKWLGLSVSSESEISETEEEVVRKSYKKKRIISQSPKKSRRFDRDSRASDSDERRYEKQKCRHQSRLPCGCRSARHDDEECNHGCVRNCRSQKHNISSSSKRRRQYDDDESSDFSDDTSRHEKRRKCKRHEVNEDKSDEERDKVQTRKCYRNVSKNNDDDEIRDVNIACSKGCQTQVNMSMLGDGQNMEATNTQTGNKDIATVDTNVLSAHCHTFKMGNLSFRNSLGKVFPLKHPQMKDTGTATSDEWEKMAAVSDVQNSLVISNPRHSATTHSSPLKNKQMLPTENESFSISYVQTDKDTKRPHVQISSNNQHSVPTDLHESPFKNVVLTPSMSDTFLASFPQQQKAHKNLAGDIGDDNISDMEVEQSDIAINKSSQFAHSRFLTTSYAQSSHLKKNTAARFRHFWLEKKKNISQNLKSLFSKRNQALEKSLPRPMWQIFSATHGQPVSSSLSRAAESPSSFCRSASVTSPLMSQMSTVQPHSENFSENMSSFSVQTAQCRVTPQLTDITSVAKMSPEVFALSGRNLQQTSLLGNSLVEWLPTSGPYEILNCRLDGVVDVSVSAGELTDQKTAAIVNWTDGALTHTVTSCSRAVASKAGPLMQAACNDYIGTQGHSLEAPDVLMTPAGGRFDSSVQVILHAVEPAGCGGEQDNNSCALMEVFANCLRFARTHLGLRGISCPLIGEGTFPFITCVQSFLEAVLAFPSEHSSDGGLFHVHLIIGDTTAAKMAANFIRSYLECVFCGNSHGQSGAALIGHKQHMRHPDVISRTRTECPPAQKFTVERTDSGRPRLKRPRL